jgi:hypothetical protein
MKKLILLALLLCGAQSLLAQRYATDKGVWQLGGSIDAQLALTSSRSQLSLAFTPQLGYFVAPNFSLGILAGGSYTSSQNTSSSSFLAGLGAAYYFNKPEQLSLPFVQLSVIYQNISTSFAFSSRDVSPINFQLAGGLTRLLSKNVGFTMKVFYEMRDVFENRLGGYGFTIGTDVFIF